MRVQWLPLIAFIAINLVTDYLIWRHLKNVSPRGALYRRIHIGASIALFAIIVAAMIIPKRSGSNTAFVTSMWLLYTYLACYIPRYIALLVRALSYIPKLGVKVKKGIRWTAFGVGAAVFFMMVWGALVTPYTTEVRKVDLAFERLPDDFDGYRIVHISDAHLGTYNGDTAFISRCVDVINALHPDLICFTGDLVSRVTKEAYPFYQTLLRLKATDGVMAVLGNHDYDDYMDWQNDDEKNADRQALVDFEKSLGWNVLNNRSTVLRRGDSSILIVGTENVGDPPFPSYGDLDKACPDGDSRFKILLQHNPYAWREQVVGKTDIDLTLAGHTHAMQIMLSIGNHRMSPAKFRYNEWGGTYTDGDQTMYVNIGLGMVGFPMRIGATPEITLITLHKK